MDLRYVVGQVKLVEGELTESATTTKKKKICKRNNQGTFIG